MDTSDNNYIDTMWDLMCSNSKIESDQAVYVLKDVAKIFGVSMSTVRRWSTAGSINSWLLGPRKRVVAVQELKRYLKEQCKNAD